MTVKDRVQRGMILLDDNLPGWEERIDLETLDLGDCELCVLGQLFGDFVEGGLRLWFDMEIEYARLTEHGFDGVIVGNCEDIPKVYADLTQEWATQIKDRLPATKPIPPLQQILILDHMAK